MTEQETIATLILQNVPGIGLMSMKRLIQQFGSAEEVVARHEELPSLVKGFSREQAQAIARTDLHEQAKREWEFANKHGIRCLGLGDDDYPAHLQGCVDAPLMLFYKGSADLNSLRIVSIVGTRHATDYGRTLCNRFVSELQSLCPDALIVSGLAYGIDICAHRAALEHGLATIAVLAHGLDRIYPPQHRAEATRIISHGGLLTEFPGGTNPDRYNFVQRNRIIAGISDAVIVVESALKGGSLITASLANDYGRECFAFPGPVGSPYSEGCNNLIRTNSAMLLQSAAELVEAMCWNTAGTASRPIQRSLFPELNEEEKRIVNSLRQSPTGIQVNTLTVQTGIPIHRLTATLLDLEMKGVVRSLAGGSYRLLL